MPSVPVFVVSEGDLRLHRPEPLQERSVSSLTPRGTSTHPPCRQQRVTLPENSSKAKEANPWWILMCKRQRWIEWMARSSGSYGLLRTPGLLMGYGMWMVACACSVPSASGKPGGSFASINEPPARGEKKVSRTKGPPGQMLQYEVSLSKYGDAFDCFRSLLFVVSTLFSGKGSHLRYGRAQKCTLYYTSRKNGK